MKYDWPFVRKAFLMGLAMTIVGVVLVIYLGWDEAPIFLLGIGSVFLICSVMLTLSYLLIARSGTSHLPENWENLSLEEKHDFARERLLEKNSWSSKAALWVMQMNDTQRQRGKGFMTQRED